MGLDMDLTKHIYVGANYEHRKVTGTVELTAYGEPIEINLKRISYIAERVMQWRKANAIHKWFVDNCQDGVDECQTVYVSEEKLQELLDLCKRVKKNHALAGELLPTQSGYFFGDTAYDEWYWEDINYTIKNLTSVLKEKNKNFDGFYYHSSWQP